MQQIVNHCLEKDPANRFQSARDLSFALTALAQGSSSTVKIPMSPQRLPWQRRVPVMALVGLTLLALGVGIGRLVWRTPPASEWSGTRLGGPEYAIGPRISPDGKTLAFLAFVGTITQVAVMKPETGNWAILTHDTQHGFVHGISWSADGSQIFYDRRTDVPHGIFSIPALGGDEHLVLADAGTPEALPDGSLLVLRTNPEGARQLFRFKSESGAIEPFPIEVPGIVNWPSMRAFPDGRQAVIGGQLIEKDKAQRIQQWLVDLASKEARVIDDGASLFGTATAARDGESVLEAILSGDLTAVRSARANGNARARTLFTTSETPFSIDSGPDGSVYLDQVERPVALVRFGESGVSQKIDNLGFASGNVAFLPDGRALIQKIRSGHYKLMVWQAGKESVPAANTSSEDTGGVATPVGPDKVAFYIFDPTIKPTRFQLAISDLATGAILRRFTFDKGLVTHLAATPDGKTLFLAAGGFIWSMPSTGGEPTKLRPGQAVAVDPNGEFLLVTIPENKRLRLVRTPLNGGREEEIHIPEPYSFSDAMFGSSSISRSGRVLLSLTSPDSWFYSPGVIDLATGRLTRIPADPYNDYFSMGWTRNGEIIAVAAGLKAELWRFQRESR